jgi:hypothetical protein
MNALRCSACGTAGISFNFVAYHWQWCRARNMSVITRSGDLETVLPEGAVLKKTQREQPLLRAQILDGVARLDTLLAAATLGSDEKQTARALLKALQLLITEYYNAET